MRDAADLVAASIRARDPFHAELGGQLALHRGGGDSLHGAQDPAHATEFRKPTPGPGPDGQMQSTFLAHRLGSDHSEGISLLDMNGDGLFATSRPMALESIVSQGPQLLSASIVGPETFAGSSGLGYQVVALFDRV